MLEPPRLSAIVALQSKPRRVGRTATLGSCWARRLASSRPTPRCEAAHSSTASAVVNPFNPRLSTATSTPRGPHHDRFMRSVPKFQVHGHGPSDDHRLVVGGRRGAGVHSTALQPQAHRQVLQDPLPGVRGGHRRVEGTRARSAPLHGRR
jgi:hypothetical protein